MHKKVWTVFILLFTLFSPLFGQLKKDQWVDSVFQTLDLNGKIGQMLIVHVASHNDAQALEKEATQIRKNKVGGVIFTKGGPIAQVNLTNQFQQEAEVPLFIGMNTEGGIGSSLDSTNQYPATNMLGAVRDDSLIFFLGTETGRQFSQLGVNLAIGPSMNVGTCINSFGENQDHVVSKIIAYQNGLAAANIASTPVFTRTSAEVSSILSILNKQSLGPVVDQHTDFILSGHGKLLATKLTNATNALVEQFSSASLRKKINPNGVIISSVPNIKKFNTKFRDGDSEAVMFKAGYNMLLNPENLNAAIRRIKKTLKKNKSLQLQLDETVKKILALKYDAGLYQKKIINTENLYARLNTPGSAALQKTLYEKSVVVVKDEQQYLPIKQLDNVSFASLSIGGPKESTLTSILSKYVPFNHFKFQVTEDTVSLQKNLLKHDWVVVAVYPTTPGLEILYPELIRAISSKVKVIVVNMGPVSNLSLVEKMSAIVQAHDKHELIQQFIPQLIFGAKKADGELPVSLSEQINLGQGLQTTGLNRISYSIAEQEGLDSRTLKKIAAIAQEAIDQKSAPGCQVLITRHGKLIYEKSFGSQTYENKIAITDQTIYDLASVSKVMGTLQAVMFLYEKGMIDIYKKASVYLPELQNTNKKDIILKDVLTHQSGLAPFLLMWNQTVKGDTLLAHYYSVMRDDNYPLQVAPNLYASRAMQDSIWHWLLKSDMLPKPARTPYSTRYSDLGFMILHRLVERLINQPMNEFLNQNLYEPLGAGTTGYLPLMRFAPTQIAPTEIDTLFRKTTVVGTVHDERAAMLGGVAGHAGLFSDGIDLLKLGQMLLQKGTYGGQQYYRPETVELFSQKQFDLSTRGLGWAKPGDSSSPSSRLGSPKAFGHTGFTGTCIWMDPEFDLVFVFLSNSRFPNRSGKLNTTNIRSRIQETIYQSIFNYCQYGENEPDRELMEYLRKVSN